MSKIEEAFHELAAGKPKTKERGSPLYDWEEELIDRLRKAARGDTEAVTLLNYIAHCVRMR